MKIAIIGTGNVGGVLGRRWAQAGHSVIFGSRTPSSVKVNELLKSCGAEVTAASIAGAVAAAEVVVLATPWGVTGEVVKAGGDWRGKIVLDTINPLAQDLSGLTLGCTTSAAEMIAGWAHGARVVKAFNSTGAGNMADPSYGDQAATMFICGDDDAAKRTAGELAVQLGFEVVDAGPLVMARALEPLALLWISLAYGAGLGPNIAFRLMKR